MNWIGLTGGIATGKSTASRLLREFGMEVIDADVLAREVVVPGSAGLSEIVQTFGEGILLPNGELDRKHLGQLIFGDQKLRAKLEGITHPYIRALTEGHRVRLRAEGKPAAFYDVPLLFEKNMQPLFDQTLLIACSREMQLERLVLRDGLTRDEAERRLNAQLPIKNKISLADDVILNEGSVDELRSSIKDYLKRVVKRSV